MNEENKEKEKEQNTQSLLKNDLKRKKEEYSKKIINIT